MTKQNKNIEAIFELSPMQQGMLFHSIYNINSDNYFEQLSVTISGSLDINCFQQAWNLVLKKHSVLRTSFVYKKLDKMLQVVHNKIELPFSFYDWINKCEEIQNVEMNDFLENDRKTGFNLNKAPLMRIALFKLSGKKYKLIWSHHHILFDGWSLPIILKDLFKFYELLLRKENIEFDYIRPYQDYIKFLQKLNKENDLLFWKNYLNGFAEKTPLIIDNIPFIKFDDGYQKKTIGINKIDSELIIRFARENHLTLNSLLQAAWAILLHKYSKKNDIIFGATFSGRPANLEGAESMVGLFINSLPIRAKINSQMLIINWIKDFHDSLAELKDHEHSALVEIQKESELPPKQNLFDSLFVFENYPVNESLNDNKNKLEFSDFNSFEKTNYPLTIISGPGNKIKIDAAFDGSQISETSVDLLLNHFTQILKYVVINSKKSISSIEFLSKLEKDFLLPIKFIDSKLSDPPVFIRHFERIVEKFPDNIALRHNGKELSYTELNYHANKVANFLLAKNIKHEDLVAIHVNRSIEMIISILAVLKTGAGYVPIDPAYPKDRVEYILDDSKIKMLISESSIYNENIALHKDYIDIKDFPKLVEKFSHNNPKIEIHPENIAYLIYTSGSTGKPKGTILQNKSVYNFLRDFSESIFINNESRILQFASIGFDASVPEIFSPLLNGGSVQLISKEQINDLTSFGEFIINNKVTNLLLPPTFLSVLDFIDSPYLKSVLSAGEACSWNIVEKWSKKYHFVNGYGPTEASVGCTWGKYSVKLKMKTVPIGIPINNVKVYVLDTELKPVPIGVEGELYVGESALARGYLNMPDLTASKFIPNPYSEIGGERIYQTRDLVRVLPDGQLDFLGRSDNQVKLRGFRIETGEIETILNQNNLIEQAVVVLHDVDEKKLVAFIETKRRDEINITDIKNDIGSALPLYMVPSHFEFVNSLPLNDNNKIDRKKLTKYKLSEIEIAKSNKEYLSENAELLLTLVKNILKIKNANIDDNFFNLGGHSLLATKLASRIRDAFEVELPINLIFEKETLSELVVEIENLKNYSENTEIIKIEKQNNQTELNLSFSQQRMWFLQKLDKENISNNIVTNFSIIGKLNKVAFENAINKIIERHEILRTFYIDKIGKPVQRITEDFEYNLTFLDYSNLDNAEQKITETLEAEKTRIFNLSKLPLFNITLIKRDIDEFILALTMHHIISDGWSINILIKELMEFYKSEVLHKKIALPKLSVQYSDYSQWQRNWLTGKNLESQLNYWLYELKEIPDKIDLPIDKIRPPVQTFNGNHLNFVLTDEETKGFIDFVSSNNFTPFMVSLSVFKILLHKYVNQNVIVVGSPIANRNHNEIENLIGFFVNTLVLKTEFHPKDKVIDILKSTREKTLQAFLHQDLPFEYLVDKLHPKRDMSHSPIFQVAFIYQNPPEEKIELPELQISAIQTENRISKYDLSLYIQLVDKKINATLEYNTDLFEYSTIERMVNHFKNLLNEIVKNPQKEISKLALNSENEFKKNYYEFCLGKRRQIEYNNVSAKFYDVVKKHSDETAITFSEFDNNDLFTEQITYEELNERSNQLARYLISNGLKKEELVGVSLKRSIDLIISIVAIIKAGGAFVPIDPFYPSERIKFMIDDSQMKFFITHELIKPNLTEFNGQIILLDQENKKISQEDKTDLIVPIESENLLYVIYTSGSTGNPKGTLLNHKGLINLVKIQKDKFNITCRSKILQFSSLSFDAFVWETFMALLNGASINLVTQEIIGSIEHLVAIIKVQKITTITLPPSVLNVIPQNYAKELNNLKTIIVAGEKCSNELANKWQENRNFFNAYGPTETTVCASIFLYNKKSKNSPPIGKPNENFSLYVLDKNMNMLPVGIPGELYIAGVGLARGYLNLPNLTAERFLPDPFSDEQGSRMYKTGDLVKFLSTGDIEFIGRIDNQVKLRGFRIELGEIESVIQSYKGIEDVVVLFRNENGTSKNIVAYLIWSEKSHADIRGLKIYLRDKLPEYMIPSAFMSLNKFPLTPNKKINFKAFPVPDLMEIKETKEYVEPRNHIEEVMIKIAKELLNIEKMGIHDNFFELGGHSLLATQFISRIKLETKKEITLKMLFEYPTVFELSSQIENINEINDKNEKEIIKSERSTENLDSLLNELDKITDNEAKSLFEKE